MLNRTFALVVRYLRKLWVRITAISMLALIATFAAPLLTPLIPDGLEDRLDAGSVLPVLTILASGMLAVTTFSLNVMVTAYRAAASQATPRAYRLLLEDTVTQNALATFVGAFLFSLVAIILYRAGIYSKSASVAVFGFMVLVVALIVIAILRWIDHLSRLGSMDHTLQVVEERTRAILEARSRAPCLGGRRGSTAAQRNPPPDARPVPARTSGYVQIIDMPRLHRALERAGATATVARAPGEFVLEGHPLLWVNGGHAGLLRGLADHVVVGKIRSFEQDARLGVVMLAEIAVRALSPGVNDPGTAIEVLGRQEGLLWSHGAPDADAAPPKFPRITVPPVSAADLVWDAFGAIARDGAGEREVAVRLAEALGRLARHPDDAIGRAARDMLEPLSEHVDAQMTRAADREAVRRAFETPPGAIQAHTPSGATAAPNLRRGEADERKEAAGAPGR